MNVALFGPMKLLLDTGIRSLDYNIFNPRHPPYVEMTTGMIELKLVFYEV